MTVLIKTIPVGYLETNCYVVTSPETLQCVVVDPGDDSNEILDYLESNHLALSAIFITHGHFDHTRAAAALRAETGAPLYISQKDAVMEKRDMFTPFSGEGVHYWKEGDEITAAGMTFQVLETPGHSPGSVTLKIDNVLFTGDTLFRDSCGRTDFAGGDTRAMAASLLRLSKLEGDYEVYPGHMGATTLERERRFNPFIPGARTAP